MTNADALIDIAFEKGFQSVLGDPRIQAKFPKFWARGPGVTPLDDFFVFGGVAPPPCPSGHRRLHTVFETPDRKGITFGWSAAGSGKLLYQAVPWIDLMCMPAPRDAYQMDKIAAQHRARYAFEIVTSDCTDKIKQGDIELQGCIGSPLVEPKALAPHSLRYLNHLDWETEFAVIGNDPIYNLRPLNRAQGAAPRPILPRDRALTLIKTRYPLGVPPELSHAELTRQLSAAQGNPKISEQLKVDTVRRAREVLRRSLQAQSRA